MWTDPIKNVELPISDTTRSSQPMAMLGYSLFEGDYSPFIQRVGRCYLKGERSGVGLMYKAIVPTVLQNVMSCYVIAP